jgi:hypothetical protein
MAIDEQRMDRLCAGTSKDQYGSIRIDSNTGNQNFEGVQTEVSRKHPDRQQSGANQA